MSRAPAILLLLTSACATPSVAVPASTGALEVSASLEIGPVALDHTGTASLALSNVGSAGLDLAGALTGAGFSFEDGATDGAWRLGAGSQLLVAIRFTPADGSVRSGLLTLVPDPEQVLGDDAGPFEVFLTGTPDPDADDDGSPHPDAGGDDCDDADATVFPGAAETWYDGTDQDCDGNDDDQDGDGYARRDDCDDQDAALHPGADDSAFDGVDNDCDGYVDLGAVSALVGAVIVTELLATSTVATGEDGQWVEIANIGDGAVSIDGWRLGDEDSPGLIDGPETLEPGDVLLLCAEDNPVMNGGQSCDGEVRPWPSLGGASGLLAVLAPVYTDRGAEGLRLSIDQVAWDGAWPWEAGASTQLDPDAWDATANDDPSSWCLGTSGAPEDETVSADLGTPGEANTPCP